MDKVLSLLLWCVALLVLGYFGVANFRLRKATQRLRQQEERFALAVRGTHDGLWDWDVGTNEVSYAPRFKAMLGFADPEFPPVFSSFESRLHPEDRDRTLQNLQQHLR